MSIASKRNAVSKISPRFYCPPNFQAEIHLPEHLRPYADDAVYLLHVVYQAKAIQRLSWKTYVPLMADYLREVVPNYKEIRQALVDNQVLDELLPARPGVHSTGHRFHPDMISGKFTMIEPTDPDLIRRYQNSRRRTEGRIKWPVHKHLKKWLDKVEIDQRQAHKTAQQLYGNDPETHGHQIFLIDSLASGQPLFTVDAYGNRVHTPVTSLSSSLRQHLTIGGEKLVGLDVACSQPYFLCLVILNAWFQRDHKADNIHGFTLPRMDDDKECKPSEPFPKPKSLFPDTSINPLPSLLPYDAKVITTINPVKTYVSENEKILSNPGLKVCPDLTQFARDILDGSFYDNLIEPYHKRSRRKSPPTRKEIKGKVFGALYCHPRDNGAMVKILEAKYPTAMSLVATLKGASKDYKAATDYKRVSKAMQRQESWAMLGCIVRELSEEHPTIPIVTIHDSILTTAINVETVKRIMVDNFRRLGLIPRIEKTEY